MNVPTPDNFKNPTNLKVAFSFFWLAFSVLLLSGCATITSSDNQQVTFSSDPPGANVSINGVPQGTTPVTIMLDKRAGDQIVSIQKEGYQVEQFKLQKHIAKRTFIAGPIGLAVDAASGKGREYQDSVQVRLLPFGREETAVMQKRAAADQRRAAAMQAKSAAVRIKTRGGQEQTVTSRGNTAIVSPPSLTDAPTTLPIGFYANTPDFDTLDGVTVDAQSGHITLFGHQAGSGAPRPIHYLDLLAAAVECNNPTFSLEWTPESRRSIDRAFAMADQELTNRLAGTVDRSGHVTKRGEWWYRMLGADVREGMDKMSLWTAVFAAAGYPDAAKVMKAIDAVERAGTASGQKVLDPDGHRRSPLEHFFNAATSVYVSFDQNFLNTYAAALNGDGKARETLFTWALRGLARAYKLDENRYLNRYESFKRGGDDFGLALDKTLAMSQDDTIAVQTNAFHALVGKRSFIHVPPDIMQEVLGVSPVVVPVYEGLPARSLLGKVAFYADAFGKNLMDMPEIKPDVPGYRTYFEWRQTVDHAPAIEGHTWFGPEAFELIESADGGTVRFGKTRVRIYMERYNRGPGNSGRRSIEDPLLRQYADELTALYDPLAVKFPVLIYLRESMKVMAIAEWLQQKGIKLSFPKEGRGYWDPPAQYPGVIHMEMAVDPKSPVGEVISASGGIDFRVGNNWQLTKQRIEEQPGPPPAHGVIIGYNPSSGAVAATKPMQAGSGGLPVEPRSGAENTGQPAESRSAADATTVNTAGDIQLSVTRGVFTCYRIDASKSGCLEIRNNSTRRVRLYIEGRPGVQLTVEAGSYATIPLAVSPYHLQIVADDERGVGPTIDIDIDLTTEGVRIILVGGTP